jgi:predicted phosphoribosyltransferase
MTLGRLRTAGILLADKLRTSRDRPIVLAIPSRGAVVGAAVAQRLHVPLDLVLARKVSIGAIAIGAVALPASRVLDPSVAMELPDVERAFAAAAAALERRLPILRGDAPMPDLVGRSVIVVDDAAITGATLEAALRVLAHRGAASVVVAVPYATPASIARLRELSDDVVTLEAVAPVIAIRRHASDDLAICPPISDDEVRRWSWMTQHDSAEDLFDDLAVDGLDTR